MTEEDMAIAVLQATAIMCKNRSDDMACVLLIALYKLHDDTKNPDVTTEDFIKLVSEGIREIESNLIPQSIN